MGVPEESQMEPPHGTMANSLTPLGPPGWSADLTPTDLRATCWLPLTQSGSPDPPRGLTQPSPGPNLSPLLVGVCACLHPELRDPC